MYNNQIMRVAVVASLLKAISPESTGGTEAFAQLLTEGLVEKGVDTTLFATSDSKTSAKLESVCSSKQTTGVFEGDLDTRIPYQIFQAGNVIEKSMEFDVIHNNYFHFYLLSTLSRLTDKPVVTTMHNHYWQLPNLKSILSKTQVKEKDIVVFSSKAAQKLSENLFDSEVIYHGINIEDFPYSPKSGDYFFWFSRISPSKGIKDAIDASFRGNFHLTIAGGMPIRSEEKDYFRVNVEPNFSSGIKYAGSPKESEKKSLYGNAKALIFPTYLEEQFGLVMVEAMACGTPVIAYNRGAVSEVVQDGMTGFIIDPDNEDRPGKGSWIIKSKGIAGLVEASKRIGEIDRSACRAHVNNLFNSKRMIMEYIDLYQRLAER